MHLTRKRTLLATTATLMTVLSIGCGGSGGSKSSASTVAPSSSSTPTQTTSGTTAGATSGALFDPAGQVAAATSASAGVKATLTTDAYVAFKESQSISDLVIPIDPALRDRAFVLEDKGSVRVLDLSGATPRIDHTLNLFAAPLGNGATGKLNIQGANVALAVTSGPASEGVAVFDPLNATVPGDVVWFDLGGVTATFAAGTLDSQGMDVGGQALPMTYTSDAAISAGKLIFTSSNLQSNQAYSPGTITAYDYDPQQNALSGGAFLVTSVMNPTGITRVQTAGGELLLVTNSGPYGAAEGSIDVVDPQGFRMLGTIHFPSFSNPGGQVTISPDGKRGYVGSQSKAEVYVVDLEGLDSVIGAQGLDLSARFRGGFDLQSAAPANFVCSVALSHSGNYLYAVSFNESALYVVDLVEGKTAARVAGFERSGSAASYEGLANKIAVRQGVPGVDYSGPSIFAMTINLAAADRKLQDVSVALDTVSVDKH
ncbi:MAG: hypothetical protein AB7N76_33030 [Planctomycetota bacterium]